jgi:DNA-binding NtrC family response regulator
MSEKNNILFVDDQWCRPKDQSTIIAAFGQLLHIEKPYAFHYETAEIEPQKYSPIPVLEKIESIPDLRAVILDIMFGEDGDYVGIDILEAIRKKYPTLPVFMMTSLEGNLEVIEKAMELGANEYLVKKPTVEELEMLLKIYTSSEAFESDYAIWGNSESMRKIRALIARVAVSGLASVLITGESGTGKELVARAIHRQGKRRYGPFVDKNCAFDSSNLLDSDLFGHEKGAFTGADKKYIGKIERADNGVLFLDEIGSISHELQGKLLRVLENRNFQRIGGVENIKSNFQLICATNEDPSELVKAGKLRQDLYYRIKQIEITAPPLRDRKDDIPILVDFFIRRFRSTSGASYKAFKVSEKAFEKLATFEWPGNVRELKNVIERAIILCREKTINLADLPSEIVMTNSSEQNTHIMSPFEIPKDDDQISRRFNLFQLNYLVKILERFDGNASQTVKYLFPLINSPNATYIKRFVKRLTEPPWGYHAPNDEEIRRIIDKINNFPKKG